MARRRPIALDEFCLPSRQRDGAAQDDPAGALDHAFLARQRRYAEPGLYGSPREFFRDLGAVYRAEIAELAAAGCRYVQLDEVALAMLCDPAVRAARRPPTATIRRALVELYVEAINEAVAGGAAGDGGRRAYVPRQFQGQISRRGRL